MSRRLIWGRSLRGVTLGLLVAVIAVATALCVVPRGALAAEGGGQTASAANIYTIGGDEGAMEPQATGYGITDNAKSAMSKHNGHYYQIFNNKVSWSEANRLCKEKGGHLATITSQGEQDFIDSLNSSRSRLWIGGYRSSGTSGDWRWITGEAWSYTNWRIGEPNNSSNVKSNENRAAVWPSAWNDLNDDSSEQGGYICEWGETTWKRIGGMDRIDTMSRIVIEAFPGSSSWAVVATAQQFPDALAASALAGAYNCPVILTNGNSLSVQARQQLVRLDVKNVIVLGGTTSVSNTTVNSIRSIGCSTTRVAGKDRFETSTLAFKAFQSKKGHSGYDTVIVASGLSFADALSISPYAYAKGAPIVLAGKKGLPASAVRAIKADKRIKRIVIVGGKSSVPEKVRTQLSGGGRQIVRLAGSDRFETSREIANWSAKHGMKADRLVVATGMDFPDALAGSALCGKKHSVLLMASKGKSKQAVAFVRAHRSQIKKAYVLGGKDSVPAAVYDELALAAG